MLIDMHVHSHHTPGVEASARQTLEAARAAGLEGVCFTDRHSTRNAVELIRLGAEVGVEVFVGLEIATDHGVLLGIAPSIDEFYLEEQWRALMGSGTPRAQQVIDVFNQIGGAVIAAYPYDLDIPWGSGDRIFELKGLSAVESFVPRLTGMRNALAVEAARAFGVGCTGGSDRADGLGQAATLFTGRIDSQAALVAGLRQGCWAVAYGVEIVDPVGSADDGGGRERDDRRERGDRGDRGDRERRGGDRNGRGGDRGGRGGDRGGRGGDRGGRGGDRGGDRGGRGGDRGGRGGERGERRGGDRGDRGGRRRGRDEGRAESRGRTRR